MFWVGLLLGAAVTFIVVYAAVRMAVSDALRRTLRADLIRDLALRPHELDAGDEE